MGGVRSLNSENEKFTERSTSSREGISTKIGLMNFIHQSTCNGDLTHFEGQCSSFVIQ